MSRGCHLAGCCENFRGEGLLWVAEGCFRGLAGNTRLTRLRSAECCDSANSGLGGVGWRLAKNVAFCREMGALSSWRASTLLRQPSEGKARQHNRLEGQRRRQDRARRPVASSLSSLVDQEDDAGIGFTPSKQVADWHQQSITVMGVPPQEEEEPSADQPQAPFHRTVVLGNAPNVDLRSRGPRIPVVAPAGESCRGGGPLLDAGAVRENDRESGPPLAVGLARGRRRRRNLQSGAHRARLEKSRSEKDCRQGRAHRLRRAETVVCILQARLRGHRALGMSSVSGRRRGVAACSSGALLAPDEEVVALHLPGAKPALEPQVEGVSVGPTKAARGDQAAAGGGGAEASAAAGLEAGEGRHGRLGRGVS